MGVTISTHNGSAVAREHNIRNEKVVSKEAHIDINGKHETWHDEKVRVAYERIFGDAQREYNARQTRTDRKIDNYYNEVCKDAKKHDVYEMIIGIYGKKEDGSSICDEQMGYDIMKQFVDGWKERNPNLELIGAYYHADEPNAEPHVHIDYVPVAHGYKRGMETQNGLVKALEEMGFSKQGKATAQIQWEKRENTYLESLCNSRGLSVERPLEGKKHLDTDKYKAVKELEALKGKIEAYEEEINQLKGSYEFEYNQLENIIERSAEVIIDVQEKESRLEELNKHENDVIERCNDYRNRLIKATEQLDKRIEHYQGVLNKLDDDIEKSSLWTVILRYGLEKEVQAQKEKLREKNQRDGITMKEWSEAMDKIRHDSSISAPNRINTRKRDDDFSR